MEISTSKWEDLRLRERTDRAGEGPKWQKLPELGIFRGILQTRGDVRPPPGGR